jgi:hypothetical protein
VTEIVFDRRFLAVDRKRGGGRVPHTVFDRVLPPVRIIAVLRDGRHRGRAP